MVLPVAYAVTSVYVGGCESWRCAVIPRDGAHPLQAGSAVKHPDDEHRDPHRDDGRERHRPELDRARALDLPADVGRGLVEDEPE